MLYLMKIVVKLKEIQDEQNEGTYSKTLEPKIWEKEYVPSDNTSEIGDKSTNETGSSALNN